MRVNSFVRFDNPDLKQHRCYGTVYGSICFIMHYYDFFFFSALSKRRTKPKDFRVFGGNEDGVQTQDTRDKQKLK